MPNNSSSSTKAPKSVKKTPAKGAEASKRSKDSDKKAEQSLIDVEASVHHGDANESEQSLIADNTSDTVREDQTFGQGELKTVNEYLKGKVGTDILAKHWLKDCELSSLEKSMVILGLAYELCLAKDPDYDLENEAAENNKQNNFNTKRIFHILKYVTAKVLPEDRKKFTEFICESGNVKLLEMICRQESKDGRGRVGIDRQYSWKGEFTGYERLIDLLQYVLEQQCSPEIVLCIAKKVYGYAHILCNGKQYLDDMQVIRIQGNFDYPDSVIKDCLKAAIELGYKDVVPVMLGGDIYHCIRLMQGKRFQGENRFSEALDMAGEAVAEVMSSWVNGERQSFKDEIQGLLAKGIEIGIEKLGRQDLIDELEDRGIELSKDDKRKKERLAKMLKKEGGGKVRLSKAVVGDLISTLFFNYQKELTEKLFELEPPHQDKGKKEKEINELNEKIDSKSFVKEKVLEKIKLLNLSSHAFNNWFFREVLAAIVNDEERLGKLQAVCIAICKEKVEELLRSAKVHKDVVDALKFFGVKPNQIKTSTPKKGHLVVGVSSHFSQEIEETDKALREVKGIVREMNKWSNESSEYEILSLVKILLSDKTPAFSGLSRKIIVELKSKKKEKDIKSDEVKKLKEAVNQILDEIKKGINMLAKGDSEYCIDTEDTLKHFEVINSEIKKEDKREIVELVCKSGNVKLLEMICKQENKDGGGKTKLNRQYSWKGEFTGYERLTDLLQYVLEQKCSSEIVLYIAKKVYGNTHVICNGEQYLDDTQVANIKGRSFDYPDSVIKDCLKAAIELGYKDVVPVMLGGDIYHCIRLMQGKRFQGENRFSEALDMAGEAVAEVMSSWVNCKQDLSKEVKGLLKEGIEINIKKMRKQDLIDELESREIEVIKKNNATSKELAKMLKGGGKLRLSKTVVGGLISTLFFEHRDELMEKPFEIEISTRDEKKRKTEINELNENKNRENFAKEKVFEKIKLLNSSSHLKNDWFFREVLAAIVNDEGRFNKLKAVCAAICKEPVERLLKGAEVHEDVVDTLKFFGVDLSKIDLSTVGSVETMDLNEYTSPSSAAETNKLSDQDIVDIAKYYYRWMEPINGKYLEDTNKKVFFTCTDVPSLEDKLKHYKEIQQKDLIFTSIINTGKEHWVTLVVARSVKDGKFSAYYCDSFGKGLSKKMSDVLKKALEVDANRISSSQIKQQKDEYNCGIFALENADKITRIIKDKSFTEINVKLKGKFDAGQLRKEFAKKVEEMRQSERNSEANSEDESEVMQVEDALSRVPLGSKAAKKRNEEVMKNNCRQNQDVYHNRDSGGYLNMQNSYREVRMHSGNIYKGKDWDQKGRKRKKDPDIEGVTLSIPPFSEFINMFNREYQDKVLKYELDYGRFRFLCLRYSEGSASDTEVVDFHSTESSEPDVSFRDDDEVEYSVNAYSEAINLLENADKENAVSKLRDLAEKGMPHARYALGIVEFRDLWMSGSKCKKDSEQYGRILQIIKWLRDPDLDKNLRPLNRSLLLKVQQYDIGGFGKEVGSLTDMKDSINEVLYATRDSEIKFSKELVKEDSLVPLGTIIKSDINRNVDKMNDFRFIVQCAMYELLKIMMLEKGPQKTHSAVEDAFSKISQALPSGNTQFVEIFKYVRSDMIYGHAIKLLMRKRDAENKKAIGLLNRSCTLGHSGASCLRGTLWYRGKDFSFISSGDQHIKYFDDLEQFAKESCNEIAVRIVVSEYLKEKSYFVSQNEEAALKIIEKTGHAHILTQVNKRRNVASQSQLSPQVDARNSLEPMLCDDESASSRSDTTGGIPNLNAKGFNSFLHNCTTRDKKLIALRGITNTKPDTSHFYNVYSTPEASGSTTGHNVSLSQQLSGIEPTYDLPIGYVVPQERKSFLLAMQSSTPSPTQTAKGMNRSMPELGGGDKENKVERKGFELVSVFDDLFSKDKSVLQCTKCYSFYTREQFNFRSIEMERYCKKGEYDKIIGLSEECLSSHYNKTRVVPRETVLGAYYNKGEALRAQGKYDEALQVFKKVFDMRMTKKVYLGQASIARSIAKIYYEKGEYAKAINFLKEVDSNDQEVNRLINNDIEIIKEQLKLRKLSMTASGCSNTTGNISAYDSPDTNMDCVEPEKCMKEWGVKM